MFTTNITSKGSYEVSLNIKFLREPTTCRARGRRTLLFVLYNTKFWVKIAKNGHYALIGATSYPGSSLFLPRESTLVSAGHVSPLSKQLPTRVD